MSRILEEELIEKLKKMVLTKFGVAQLDKHSCRLLSEDIFAKTKNYISTSTLERFFGLRQSANIVSSFLLNALTGYVTLQSFDDFRNSHLDT